MGRALGDCLSSGKAHLGQLPATRACVSREEQGICTDQDFALRGLHKPKHRHWALLARGPREEVHH